MIIELLKAAVRFFVLKSGRPLPVTTFFVFSKPLSLVRLVIVFLKNDSWSYYRMKGYMQWFASYDECCLKNEKGVGSVRYSKRGT